MICFHIKAPVEIEGCAKKRVIFGVKQSGCERVGYRTANSLHGQRGVTRPLLDRRLALDPTISALPDNKHVGDGAMLVIHVFLLARKDICQNNSNCFCRHPLPQLHLARLEYRLLCASLIQARSALFPAAFSDCSISASASASWPWLSLSLCRRIWARNRKTSAGA